MDCRHTVQAYNMLTTSTVNEREWCTELSTCSFQFSPKTRQTMPLYTYLTPKVDFKCKFNHHQSFLYEWWLTARTIRKFRIGPSLQIESRIGRTIQNRITKLRRSLIETYIRKTLVSKKTQFHTDAKVIQQLTYQIQETEVQTTWLFTVSIYIFNR